MSWLGTAAQKVRRTNRSTKSRKARRVRNDRRAIFFEALEPRHLLSVTFTDQEPNNSYPGQLVNSPGLAAGVVDMLGSGAVSAGDSNDYYQFQAAVTGELNVSVARTGGGPSASVTLYDNAGSVIGGPTTIDATTSSASFTVAGVNTTDVYKVGISGDTQYQVRIWNPDREDDAGGNNNSRALATSLGTLGSIPAASLQNYTNTRPDRDYFSFTSNVTGPVEVRAVMPATTGLATQPTNLGIRIRDAAGAIIASSNGTETNVDVATFNATNGGLYYVEVYSGSVGQVNKYDLEIQALTGEIRGYKFIDRNGNGFFDAGENQPAADVQNWQIYLDTTRNQTYDVGEPVATTAADGSYSFPNLAPGTYYVREVLPATFSQTLPGAADNYEYTVSINRDNLYLDHIDFGNLPLGNITVVKDAVPNDSQDFSYSGGLGAFSLDDDGDPTLLNSQTFANLIPGTYVVTEAAVAGWDLTALVLNDPDGGSSVDLAAGVATIDLDPGETITVTFTNTKRGSITVVKDAVPNDPQDFSFSGGLGTFSLDDDSDPTLPASQLFANLTPGTYVVTEAALAGWDLTDLVVNDPDGGSSVDAATGTATIDLDPGEAITVTFTNTKRGSITVIKDAVPDDSQDFSYSGDLGTFLLDDDSDPTLPNSQLFANLTPGTFVVTEAAVAGWSLTSLVIVDPDGGSSVNLATGTATIDLDPGEVITVTFTNTNLGSITVVKDAVPDDPQDFGYTGSLGAFSLDDDSDPTLPNSQLFANLTPGTYIVSEAALAGWDLTGLVINDPDGGSSVDLAARTATIDVDPGEAITVTFTNTKRGSITVIKDAVPDDPQDFSYSGGLGTFSLDDDSAPPLPASQLFANLTPGTYVVTEAAVAGWNLTNLVIVDPDGGSSVDLVTRTATVDLDPGEVISVTFTNTRQGSITVIKDAVPNDPQDFAYSGSLGAFSLDDDSDPTLPASQLFANLTPGTYVVTEAAVAGWDLTGLVIVDPDGGSSVDLASGTATIDLDPGEAITVTFTNTKRGSITVIKDAVPNDPQDFGYSGTLGAFSLDDDSDPTLPASQLFDNLTPGTYVVTEAALAGWDLTGLVINDPDGGSSVDLAAGTATIDLDPGETVTVTFTNTKRGQITVQKDVVPTDPQDFCFVGGLGSFCLDDDSDPTLPASQLFGNLTPGTYVVTEAALAGWDLTSLVINDPDGGSSVNLATRTATIDLDPGETIAVTFTNTQRGAITVIKDAVPNDPQDFSYSGSLGAFSLDDDSDPTLPASQFFGNLTPGTYVVTEAALSGWDLTSLVINDPDGGSSVDLATGTATIDVDPGETITVTFTNTKRGSITVVKDAVPNDPQDFTFSGGLGAFSLDDDSDPTLSASQLFGNLTPGTYVVTEAAVAGWDLTSLVIVDPDGGSSVALVAGTATIDLDAGETITVTFTNIKRGQITVQKDAVPSDPQDFCYTGGLGSFCLDDDIDPTLSNAHVFANWIPGTYVVTETAVPGWDLTSMVINDPDGGSSLNLAAGTATIDLDPGEAITVTFTNTKRGSITVIKDAVPNDPQDFSFSGGLGAFSLDDDADPTLPASQFFGNLTPGTYVVTEAALAGWDLTGLVINDPDGGSSVNLATGAATIDLDPGEAITVTFANTKRGSITVVKDAVPNDPQDFSFSGTLGAFSLDDDSDPTLPNSQLFANLTPGTYVVTEAAALGWTLSSLVIADPDGGSSVDLGAGTATIDLDPGETITVTFTNTVTPAFTGTKFYDQDPDGLGPLGPDGIRDPDGVDNVSPSPDDEVGLPGWTIELYQDDGDVPAPPTFEPDSPFAPAWPLTGISQANPAVVTSANHGLVTGDRVQIAGVAGMTQVNGQIYRVTVINANSFSLGTDDPLATSAPIDSTGFGAYASGGTFVELGQDKLIQTTVTDSQGNYALGSLNLPTGWYHIREMVKSGWKQTSSPRVQTVYFNGTSLTGLDFGNASCTGTLNLPNGTYPVASIRDGLLTIVYPLSSFTVDRIAVAGLDDDNDGTVDELGEEYRFFDAYNGSGGVLAGVTSVTARPDAAGWRVDILIGANDYLHAGQHPTPRGSQFQVHITTSPGAGTLTILNAVNVDVAGSLALQITGTECGELIAVGDDKVDGANSDAKAIYFGTVDGVYNGGANLTSVGIEYDKAIMDAMFGSPSISRVEVAALDGDDIVRVKEEINQQQMLNAGAGDDTVHSGSGKSQVFGGAGIDLLVGGAADDVIYGDAGDDRIFAGAGDDRVFGGLGDDYIAGFLGNDSLLKGEDGNDRVSGGDGRDRLYGDAGSDIGYRDAADLLVYQVESVFNTPPDPVELALRQLIDTYWDDTELTDGDEDGAWDTLDELIAQILP